MTPIFLTFVVLLSIIGFTYSYAYLYEFTDDELPDSWKIQIKQWEHLSDKEYIIRSADLVNKTFDSTFRQYLREPTKLRKKSLKEAVAENGYEPSMVQNAAMIRLLDERNIKYKKKLISCNLQTPHYSVEIAPNQYIDSWSADHGCVWGERTTFKCDKNACIGEKL